MKKYTFDDIRNNGLILYQYVRGSHLYGLNNVNSDIDTGINMIMLYMNFRNFLTYLELLIQLCLNHCLLMMNM